MRFKCKTVEILFLKIKHKYRVSWKVAPRSTLTCLDLLDVFGFLHNPVRATRCRCRGNIWRYPKKRCQINNGYETNMKEINMIRLKDWTNLFYFSNIL